MKQVIVVRSDIKMGKGKLAAQVAHASLSAAEKAMSGRHDWFEEWKEQGQAKIVVRAQSEEELRELFRKARNSKLPVSLIEDRGLTQLDPGTTTCLGVGPGPEDQIDAITGKLRLL
jgi:PTH2 family peptidyl-tRNA hydrolase